MHTFFLLFWGKILVYFKPITATVKKKKKKKEGLTVFMKIFFFVLFLGKEKIRLTVFRGKQNP